MNFKYLLGYVRQAKDIADSLSSKQETPEGKSEISEDMTDEQEEQFAEKQKAELSKIKSIKNPAEVMDALKILSEQASETVKFCEIQKTKRAQIRANAEVEIHRINAFSHMIEHYLDKTFDERKELFAQHFTLVDKALATGDRELLAMELQSINQLAAQSPFKSLADVKNMLDSNTTKELDIL